VIPTRLGARPAVECWSVMAPTMPNLDAIVGKDFTTTKSAETYGTIRAFDSNPAAHPASAVGYVPFAEDECGNAFVQAPDGGIWFWDHETDQVTLLAADWSAFVGRCHAPIPVELDPSQVKSVWVDPEFAKKFGLKGSAKPKGP
jgi:hypothetical protein